MRNEASASIASDQKSMLLASIYYTGNIPFSIQCKRCTTHISHMWGPEPSIILKTYEVKGLLLLLRSSADELKKKKHVA